MVSSSIAQQGRPAERGLWRERLVFCCTILFLAGCLFWMVFRERSKLLVDGTPEVHQVDQASETQQYNGIEVADYKLLPEEVVRLQVEALQAARVSPSQLEVCFALAAPSNRKVTGPFKKFAMMVSQSPYDRLITATSWQMGSTIVEGDYAAALVTTMDSSDAPAAFRFVLEKQKDEPYTNCWMTIAVQFVEVASVDTLTRSPL